MLVDVEWCRVGEDPKPKYTVTEPKLSLGKKPWVITTVQKCMLNVQEE